MISNNMLMENLILKFKSKKIKKNDMISLHASVVICMQRKKEKNVEKEKKT